MSFRLPDGKIARTMPEQVGKNMEDIEDLKTGYNQIANVAIVEGHLIVSLQDGTEFDAGVVKGLDSIVFDASRHLIVTYDDGTTADLGLIKGLSSIAFNASRHLIVTYDDGTTADLGLIKGISSFSINGSQHLIATYDDGSTQDLGAIFSGNVNISGTLNATSVTGDSIIENMSGYSQSHKGENNYITFTYTSVVKNGNKVTFVVAGKINIPTGQGYSEYTILGDYSFNVPLAVANKIFPPVPSGGLSAKFIDCFDNYNKKLPMNVYCSKTSTTVITIKFYGTNNTPPAYDTDLGFRVEETFLLSDSLIS